MHTQFTEPFTLKIALVGMMASGKTTLGKKLAAALGVPFIDADDEITAASGMPIPAYFETRGETAFRELERGTIGRLLARDGAFVMSLGGGAYMQPEIRAMLRGKAKTVFLHVGGAELVSRLEGTDIAKRPVLAAYSDWRSGVREVLAAREKIYAEADIRFDASRRNPRALAEALAELLRTC